MKKNNIMKAILLLIIFLIYAEISFGQSKRSVISSYQFKHDSLTSYLHRCETSPSISYKKLINIFLDSIYVIRDSLISNLNSDNQKDYIYILSNNIQLGKDTVSDCNKKYNKRLILVFVSTGKSYNTFISENIVPNTFDYMGDPYVGMKSENHGFMLKCYYGTRIRYQYEFIFRMKNNRNIYLTHVKSFAYDIYTGETKRYDKKFVNSHKVNLQYLNLKSYMKAFW